MKLIVCLDSRDGWIFNKKRTSRDSKIIERIIELSDDQILNLTKYSYQMFDSINYRSKINVNIISFPICYYSKDEIYFIEEPSNIDINLFEEIIIFRWNRIYPYDIRFPIKMITSDIWKLKTTNTFSGTSHDTITEEHWERMI